MSDGTNESSSKERMCDVTDDSSSNTRMIEFRLSDRQTPHMSWISKRSSFNLQSEGLLINYQVAQSDTLSQKEFRESVSCEYLL